MLSRIKDYFKGKKKWVIGAIGVAVVTSVVLAQSYIGELIMFNGPITFYSTNPSPGLINDMGGAGLNPYWGFDDTNGGLFGYSGYGPSYGIELTADTSGGSEEIELTITPGSVVVDGTLAVTGALNAAGGTYTAPIAVDSILEYSVGVGVTVDGLLIQDGTVGAGAVAATTALDGGMCGTNQILEDQGATWACIATPSGSGSVYDTVQDEGTPLTQRTDINFIGSAITCVDDGVGLKTDCTISAASFTDIDTDYGNETVTSDWIFRGAGSTGAMGAYDLAVGDSTSYGGLRLGDMGLYHSSYSSGATIDLDGSFVLRNEGTLGVSNDPGIEFAFMESISNTIRLAIPESGSGNATAFVRSGTFAGPYSIATGNDIVLCDQWTAYDSNIDCDTSATGADLFVQDDLEVEGTFFLHETINLEGATADGNQVIIQVGADPGADVTITLPTTTGTLGLDQVGTVNNGDFCQGGAGSILDCDIGQASIPAADHIDAITEIASALRSGTDAELITGTIATTNAVVAVDANDDLVEYASLVWNVTAATCTGDGNGGALTVNGSNQIVCSADDGGGSSLVVKSGEINITEGTPGTVTFSTAFSSAPWCTCTLEQAATDATCWISTDATTTSVSFDVDNSAGGAGNYDVNWICTNAGNP